LNNKVLFLFCIDLIPSPPALFGNETVDQPIKDQVQSVIQYFLPYSITKKKKTFHLLNRATQFQVAAAGFFWDG